MTYYAGLDVSLRSVNLCVIDAEGELVAETKLDSEVTDIITWLDDRGLDITQVGLEAGTLCQYLTYGLQRLVCEPGPTAKRSVTHAKTRPTICHKPGALDIKARLEEPTLRFA